jgi:DNA adenine methylase
MLTSRVEAEQLIMPLDLDVDRGPLRPLLKWAGGKRWLVPYLAPLWRAHQHRRLVEPFCGGLAAALGLMPARALLNDINPHLMNFYRWVQRGLAISLDLQNDHDYYYTARARFNELIRDGQAESREAAELFYYLNRTGYNGLCRFSRKGTFNVPFGRYRNLVYADDFYAYRPIFAGWELSCASFETLALEPDDFVYADPPYDVDFRNYSEGGFSWEQQVRLAEWLAQHPGPVVLSNQATPRIKKLYLDVGFKLRVVHGPRRISCNGDRQPAVEVLAMRNV